ncbi:ABC transporter substrate-binding protein [Gracilibacillus alcaliphilus]|uniref:ABC transporter substrate-binding protein n=1 Tax=Gracilibacillus alcaliphilus TaxID=1401441 RepID=UPI00195CC802|nr:ABC transporter substrate-binding protein [Gracilibacillus alcaliphilus]MBM7677518.1 ABC-type nitrate/sulfonate/bicarbonate transport system substrate-binding protein [Gracilibacillus alcaliphilus]
MLNRNRNRLWLAMLGAVLMLLSACGSNQGETDTSSEVSTADSLALGYATCAHCLTMSLTPDYVEDVNIEATSFASGNDVLTALVSESLDVAQVTYLHYITALDKGFDLVAISGQINGGSEILVGNDVPLEENDWDGFKDLIEQHKQSGEKFRVAASRGNAQDIHMRGEFMLHGIDPVEDLEIINIANPADHASALESGEVDMISTVEPFASQIRLSEAGKHFVYPYEQNAGNLTNLIVTRSDVIEEKEDALYEVVGGIVSLVGDLEENPDLWLDVLSENTSLSEEVSREAMKNSFPDYQMHLDETLAIAEMMEDLQYIQSDVREEAVEHMDYRFIEQATGKSAEELGK